ncbi:MAG TPA: hypothetical protein VM029_07595 [Opitutaceae bacterium]|nr:hypothetical protein [Opitutaceae bacterium]
MSLRPVLFLVLLAGASPVPAAETVTKPAPAPAPAAASAPAPEATSRSSSGRTRSSSSSSTSAAAPARTDSVTPTGSYDAFRLVSDRNIFNPNRTGRRDRTNDEKPPALDVISLVGTMESDRGLRAFFDGSESGYRKALRVGESVEKFKITQIAPNVVDLEREGKTIALRVGQQLRRPEGAEWNLIGEDVARREAQARAAGDNRPDPMAAPVIPAGASDIERRMIERRMKELRK